MINMRENCHRHGDNLAHAFPLELLKNSSIVKSLLENVSLQQTLITNQIWRLRELETNYSLRLRELENNHSLRLRELATNQSVRLKELETNQFLRLRELETLLTEHGMNLSLRLDNQRVSVDKSVGLLQSTQVCIRHFHQCSNSI